MDESLNQFHTTSSFDSTKTDPNSSPLSEVLEDILLTDSSSTTSPKLIINNNAFESSNSIATETKFLSTLGSYFISRPSQLHLHSKFQTIKTHFSHQSIRFARKDASNEVKPILLYEKTSYLQKNNYQELLQLVQNQIPNHQWPLHEYIGLQGQRAWRGLKLAADITNLDAGFMLNYHNDFDWIPSDNNFGSFNERTYLVLRDFTRRIERRN